MYFLIFDIGFLITLEALEVARARIAFKKHIMKSKFKLNQPDFKGKIYKCNDDCK